MIQGEPQEEEKKIDPAKVEAEKEKKKQEEQKRSEGNHLFTSVIKV